MVMVIDGDGDEVDGDYEKWLLNMLHWLNAALNKDFIKFDLHKQSLSVTIILRHSN